MHLFLGIEAPGGPNATAWTREETQDAIRKVAEKAAANVTVVLPASRSTDEELKEAAGRYKVVFDDILISSYQTGGSSGDVSVNKSSPVLFGRVR